MSEEGPSEGLSEGRTSAGSEPRRELNYTTRLKSLEQGHIGPPNKLLDATEQLAQKVTENLIK